MHKLRTIIAGGLGVAGLATVLAVPAASAAPVHHQHVNCALSVSVGHNSGTTSARNTNSNPCGRFYWAYGLFLIGGNQSQHDSRGVQSGKTSVSPPGATRNCGGGYKWSDSTGTIHQIPTYGSPSCA